MKRSSQIKRAHTDRKIKISGIIYLSLVLVMLIIVIIDSFQHELPFYYILFFIAGLVIGKLISMTQKVVMVDDSQILSLKVKPIGMIITLLLLIFRFFAGKFILEGFNVVWATHAIYLLFIGIYFAKEQAVLKQIDEHIYTYFSENSEGE